VAVFFLTEKPRQDRYTARCGMSSTANKHVLFVDDEPNIRVTLSAVLQEHGFRVQTAATVPEAIDQIQGTRFDVLLCDLNISKAADGYAVVDAMRRANPDAVTVILTGYPDLQNAIDGIHRKIDDYFIKPADVETLVSVLKTHLSRRQPKARILSVSYDGVLLRTRHMLLEREGYDVDSATGFDASLEKCREGGFDLFVLGHSIPQEEKQKLVQEFRSTCPAPIISLRRNAGEQLVVQADYHIEPDPEPLLKVISDLIGHQEARGNKL
jgi:DNA-binding response OmpR family regulator